jgi:hypothetical protein
VTAETPEMVRWHGPGADGMLRDLQVQAACRLCMWGPSVTSGSAAEMLGESGGTACVWMWPVGRSSSLAQSLQPIQVDKVHF